MLESAYTLQTPLQDVLHANVMAAAAVQLPPVPITLATRLRLEKLVMRTAVMDLRAITETILLDPGATLQLLRIVGEEFGEDECRPTRIEHCIASLNRERWYLPVCSWVVTGRNDEVSKAWQQFSLIAHSMRQVAMRLQGFSPEEAYLVGLLHQMGKLPRLLGWTEEEPASLAEERGVGLQLARLWHMPGCLIEAMREQQEGAIGSRWSFLLRSAQWESGEGMRTERVPASLPVVGPVMGRPVMVGPRQAKFTRE